jgi:methyl-accepting chemotaxis protein
MPPSILKRVLLAFLGFGVVVAGIFPFYANFFVEWKPGMLTWFVVGCFIAGLFIGIANYYVMKIVLVSKLKRISQVAGAIANKDLTFTCSMVSHDTIGDIIISFNNMASTLRELIAQASQLSSQVRQDSDGIRDQTDQIRGHVHGLGGLSRDISQSIQQLDTAVAEIAQRSQQASAQAGVASSTARSGIEVARESITGMERIHERVSGATTRVQHLAESAEQVGSIVAVIKEIADQTNLLALNAAIEAARAGEQGRGFAVVADEVRKLAEKTSDATNQISQMITAIQGETKQAISAIGDSMREAETGVDQARRSGEALERIIDVVQQVVGQVEEIAHATSMQKSSVQSVRGNIETIDALNQQTLTAAEQGVGMATHLAAQSNNLDDAVKSFRL